MDSGSRRAFNTLHPPLLLLSLLFRSHIFRFLNTFAPCFSHASTPIYSHSTLPQFYPIYNLDLSDI